MHGRVTARGFWIFLQDAAKSHESMSRVEPPQGLFRRRASDLTHQIRDLRQESDVQSRNLVPYLLAYVTFVKLFVIMYHLYIYNLYYYMYITLITSLATSIW